MRILRICMSLFLCAVSIIISYCQITFRDQTSIYNPSISLRSGSTGAIADINHDGYDDILAIDKANTLYIGYNQGPQQAMKWIEGPKVSSSKEYLTLLTDLDNDGELELITSGSFSNTKIYKLQPNGAYKYHDRVVASILSQGGNTVDINNDGFLDYFLCSDESDNLVALNDSTGSLIRSFDYFDWTTIPPSDGSGNYASEWADVNGDGLIDLAIAKCRLGVSDPTDPTRINRLFIQKPDGTFVDEASLRGFDIGFQSWTVNLEDLDNDGDIDAFITNHDSDHQLLINNGDGYFSEKPLPDGVDNFSFQSFCRDFNNDGWLDILVLGAEKNLLLVGKGEADFDLMINPFGGLLNSGLVGDLDKDGYMDVVGFYSVGINSPGLFDDAIFINNSQSSGNYLKVNLEGTISNRLGIGSEIKLFIGDQILTRTVKSGESYGVCTSFDIHFGLGSNIDIDSVVVKWPSGIYSKVIPSVINDQITIIEDNCVRDPISIVDSTIIICSDSIILEAPSHYAKYLWSTGGSDRRLTILSPGVYEVTLTDSLGCLVKSKPIIVNSGKVEYPLISSMQQYVSCKDDTVAWTVTQSLNEIEWSTGQNLQAIYTTGVSEVHLVAEDKCGELVKDSLSINLIDANDFTVMNDTVPKGGDALLIADGEDISWYATPISTAPISHGDTLRLANVTKSQTFYARNRISVANQKFKGGKILDTTDVNQFGDSQNVGLYLDVFDPVIISNIKVYSFAEGNRTFAVLRDDLTIIDSVTLYLGVGIQSVPVELKVEPGNVHIFTCLPEANMKWLGTVGPQLAVPFIAIEYPYTIDRYVDILSSTSGPSAYGYFFDIEIEVDPVSCFSESRPVTVYLDTDVGSSEYEQEELRIFPNPAKDYFYIKGDYEHIDLGIFRLDGTLVKQYTRFLNGTNLDINELTPGIYFVKIENSNSSILKKVSIFK